jgi:phospholipase A1/A2
MSLFFYRLKCVVICGHLLFSFSLQAEETTDAELVQLYHHKPMIFLVGEPITKVQFSLKAKILKNWNLYFGYSQLMLWDLFKTSRPFKDMNYNPEFFYRLPEVEKFTFEPGFEHESNGKSGEDSRSWNRIFIRAYRDIPLENRRTLQLMLKVWGAYGLDQTNADLLWYRGLYEMQFQLVNVFPNAFEVSDLTFRLFPGGKTHLNPLNGARELTLRLGLRGRLSLFQTVFQVYEGYGESLLGYRDHVLGARVGFGF